MIENLSKINPARISRKSLSSNIISLSNLSINYEYHIVYFLQRRRVKKSEPVKLETKRFLHFLLPWEMHFWPQSCLRLVESPSMLSRCSLVSFVLPTNVTRLHHINYISATRDANSNVPERQDDDDTDPRSNYISFLFSSSLRFFLQHYRRNSFRCWNYLCTNHFEIFISERLFV